MVTKISIPSRAPRVALPLGLLAGACLSLASPSQALPRPPSAPAASASAPVASASASASASAPVASASAASPSAASAAPPAPPAESASAVVPPAAAAQPAVREARVHHAPLLVVQAREEQTLHASIESPDRMKHAYLVVRPASGAERTIELLRSTKGTYAAVIPAELVAPPGFSYRVEIEPVEGERRPAFASAEAMHEVQVAEPIDEVRERATLARLGGRRSVVTTSAEYVRFGQTEALVQQAPGAPLTKTGVPDSYYRIEAGYTYRSLGLIAEFGIRGGVVRGRAQVPDTTDPSKFDVGLNYGAPTVRLRLGDHLHVEGELLTSVTEVGFSTGGGASLLLGDPYGSKLTLGFESIETFGTRIFSRFDLTSGRFGVAPIIEVTNMPHSSYGLRLLTEATLDLSDGFRLAARVGYQARDFASGGPSGGLSLSYLF